LAWRSFLFWWSRDQNFTRKTEFAGFLINLYKFHLNFLAYLQHTYVVREGVTGVTPRVEAHEHGVENSLWWNINTWAKR